MWGYRDSARVSTSAGHRWGAADEGSDYTDRASRKRLLTAAIGILLGIGLLVAVGGTAAADHGDTGVSATPISSCQEIDSSGYYYLEEDNITASGSSCIQITTGSVTFDGHGNTIKDGGFSTDAVSVTADDVVVKDFTAKEVDSAVVLEGDNSKVEGVSTATIGAGGGTTTGSTAISVSGTNNEIRNNNLFSAGDDIDDHGISVSGSSNLVVDNEVYDAYGANIQLYEADGTNVSYNLLRGDASGSRPPRYGIRIGTFDEGESNDNYLYANEIYGDSNIGFGTIGMVHGIVVQNGTGNELESNFVTEVYDQGIIISDDDTTVIDGSVTDNGEEGILIYGDGANVTGTSVRYSGRKDTSPGIDVVGNNTRIANAEIRQSSGAGLRVDADLPPTVTGVSIDDNDGWAVEVTNTPSFQIDRLDLGTDAQWVRIDGQNFKVDSGTEPSADLPADKQAIGIYLTGNAAGGTIDQLAVKYPDSAVESVNESSLRMWYYDGSWVEASGNNGVNTGDNLVFGGASPDEATFAPVADNELPTAALSASPSNATTGEVVTFDASGSSDPDGEVVEYRWDFDGDGITDETTSGSETAYIYTDNGTYDATVTAVDDGGGTDTAAVTVTVEAGMAAESWPQFGYDSQNTGYAPENTGPTGAVVERWQYTPASTAQGPVVVSGETAFIGVGSEVHAVHLGNGTRKWTYAPNSGDIQSLAFETGVLYVGADSTITAVFAETGEERWERDTSSFSVGYTTGADELLVADDTVYAALTDDGLHAFHASNGTLDSSFSSYGDESYRFETPAYDNGTVYVGGEDYDRYDPGDGFVVALDAENGTAEWERLQGSDEFTSPAVHNGTVYVGGPSTNDTFYALDAATGNVSWNRSFDETFVVGPSVANGTVYVPATTGGGSGNLTALSAADGSVEWVVETGTAKSAPAITNGTVYTGSASGAVYALDTADGSERWNESVASATDGVESNPAVGSGSVYIVDGAGTTHALTGRDVLGPANFSVTLDVTNLPVAEGEPFEIQATVANVGGYEGTQTVALSVDGTERDTQQVTVPAQESASVTLSWDTQSGDAGDYTTTVESVNDSASLDVTIDPETATSPRQLNYCTVLDEPGVYELTADIVDSGADTCIKITASDVVFDGQGHAIDMPRSAEVVNVTSTESLSNVTVRNVRATGGQHALVLDAESDGATVSDIRFVDNRVAGTTYGVSADADGANQTVDLTVANNRMTGVDYGSNYVDVDGDGTQANVSIVGNVIDSEGAGVSNVVADGANQTVDIEIADNDITASFDAVEGLELDGEGSPTTLVVRNNTLHGDTSAIDGVDAEGANRSATLRIANNDVTSGNQGVENLDIDGANQTVDLTIADNAINTTDEGIQDIEADGSEQTASLVITDNDITSADYDGIEGVDAGGANQTVAVTVANNTIEADDAGTDDLELDGTNQTVTAGITDNEIAADDGIYGIGGDGTNQSVSVTVTGNSVNATDEGIGDIDIAGAGQNGTVVIADNNITSVDNAVYDIDTAGSNQTVAVDIAHNTIDTQGAGIYFTEVDGEDGTSVLNVTDNDIASDGYGFDEILANGANQSVAITIEGNNVTTDESGIYYFEVDGSNQSVDIAVTDNNITASDYGIEQLDLTGSNQTGTINLTGNSITGFSAAGIYFDDLQVRNDNAIETEIVANDIESSDSGTDGVRVDSATGTGTPEGALYIAYNDIDTARAAVRVTAGPVGDIGVHNNVLAGDNYGIENANVTSGYINATNNYWNASDGPGSTGGYEDPVTGTVADGNGTDVTGLNSSVSNVHFDPWLSAAPEPNVTVGVNGTNTPVTEGETLTVDVTAENVGTGGSTERITLSVGGTQRDSETVTLKPGESRSMALAWETTDGDAGSYTATVESDNDTATASVTVEEAVTATPTPTETTPTPTETTPTPTETSPTPTDATPTPTDSTPTDTTPTDTTATSTDATPTGTATATPGDGVLSGDGPGFGGSVAILALLATALLVRRRG